MSKKMELKRSIDSVACDMKKFGNDFDRWCEATADIVNGWLVEFDEFSERIDQMRKELEELRDSI